MNRKKAGIRVPLPAFRDRAFTLLELIVAMALLLLLTSVALPIARNQVKRAKEVELRRDLREMRQAIDRYKDFADRGMIAANQNTCTGQWRSEEHTSELQSRGHLVCRLLLEKKKN